jgi:autotransporter-associated beta strand protein
MPKLRFKSIPRLFVLEARTVPSTSIPLSTSTWTAIGPAPATSPGANSGRTVAIACDPTNVNVVYIGAASGGVWKTSNANSTPPTWTPLTDGQAALTTGANSIAIAPTDHNTIYVGTGEPDNSADSYYGRGVLKSTDGGNTWTLFNDGGVFDRRTMSRVVVSPTDANTVYVTVYGGGVNGAGGTTGVFRSTNGGTSWTNLTAAITTSTGFSDFAIDPSNPNLAYAAVGSAFGATANGVYVTANLQATTPTWTPAPGVASGSANGRTLLAVSPSNPGTVYAEIDSSASPYNILAFYQSTNSGVTWTDRVAGNGNFPVTCPSGQGWYDMGLIVDPSNPNTVVISGSSGSTRLQRSTDGGQTWNTLLGSGTNPHVDHHALAFDASGRLFDGDDGGVYRLNSLSPITWVSLNGAASGTSAATGLNTNQFVGIAVNPTNANLAIGGTQDNGTQRFSDSFGWTSVDGGDGGNVLWDVNNTNYLYRVSPVGSFGTANFVRRSTNGGTSFSSITSGIVNANNAQFYPPLELDPAPGSHRVFLGTNVVNVLPDGTSSTPTWSQYGVPPPSTSSIRSIGIGAADPNTLYVGSGDGNIYVTTNGGASWQMRTPSSGGSWQDFAVDPTNSNIAYAVSDNFSGSVRIWKTTNSGASWTSLMGTGLPNLPTSSVLLDPGGTLYVGDDQGVYSSTNGGTTWSKLGTGLPTVIVSDLDYSPALSMLAAGTYGRGVWELLTTPAITYADTRWSGMANGTVIADADPVAAGNQPAVVGTTAFGSVNAALGAVAVGGRVVVNGSTGGGTGNFNEAVIDNIQLNIILQAGAVSFGSLAGTATGTVITDNGTGLNVGGNNTATEFDGVLAGGGSLTKTGSGTFTLTGANTYTGGTTISGGAVAVAGDANLGNSSGGLVFGGGTLQATGAVTSSRAVTLNASGGSVDTNGNAVSLSGPIGGAGGLAKVGAGTLTLGGTDTYAGTTTVSAGILLVNGSETAPVSVAPNATLGGIGTVGNTTVDGILSPGNGVGVITTGSATIDATGTLSVNLNGPVAGTGYSQLAANGAVALTGSTLVVTLANGFTPGPSDTFDILVNNSGADITGTFNNLAEGDTFTANGKQFKITYKGGTSHHDVVLNPAPPVVTGLQVNDGSNQRSEVRSIKVTFSDIVTFAGGDATAAFTLQHIQTSTNVGLAATVGDDGLGHTTVTLVFSGADTDPVSVQGNANPVAGPSLADGRYTLTIDGNAVTGSNGVKLDGAGNGTPGSPYVSAPDSFGGNGPRIYRLYGDVTGDGVNDPTDLNTFRLAFNTNNQNPGSGYLAFLDANNDGAIDPTDLNQYRTRFNTNVFN